MWDIVKKAINSNLNKTLDTLIEEKVNEIISTVKTRTIPIVKSVQRGCIDRGLVKEFNIINISEVNTSKSLIIVDYLNSDYGENASAVGEFNNSKTLRIITSAYNRNTLTITWQVIEFY